VTSDIFAADNVRILVCRGTRVAYMPPGWRTGRSRGGHPQVSLNGPAGASQGDGDLSDRPAVSFKLHRPCCFFWDGWFRDLKVKVSGDLVSFFGA
jgi:hypothetical protein